ncbi:MAG: biotin/lipoyl-binding protein [Gammaproteobacteria bacterium]|nr:biotin/lipoyl-binding protein [Gammaproteobacteria bacterium]
MAAAAQASADESIWLQVALLRPRLRHGVEVLVQDYRGERWYLLHDKASGRFLRFNAVAYAFLGRIDGDLTIQEIVEIANDGFDEPLLEPDDILQILSQLHGAEVLRGGLPLSVRDLLERHQQAQRFRRQRALSNPLALRIRLFDPDRLLTALLRPARWIFSWSGLLVWLLVVGGAGVLALGSTAELAAAFDDKTLSTHEVLMFWALYPLIKALHELGHGLAVKVWGGEVHESGINLLVFMPVPYVDASAAWAFRDKRRRAVVGAAGILVELFVAALAFLVWLNVEPGLARDAALNVALIGSVSTLFFNGNPLLRFDGYYVLEDLVEIPNLATRSSRFYLHLMQRYLLGITASRSPVTARGEAGWFALYGMLAPIYRLGIMVGIALYLAGEFLVIGVILAAWAIALQVLRPLYRSMRFIATSPRLEAQRVRGFAVVGLGIVLAVALLQLPAPLVTVTQGVVWPSEQSRVVSDVEGFVVDVVVRSGDAVAAGDVLLRLDDRRLHARRSVLTARLRELRDEQSAQREVSRVRAAMVDDDIAAVRRELDDVQRRIADLTVRSAHDGVFYPVDPLDLSGKLVRQGEVIGYVLQPRQHRVRAVVDQAAIGLLRSTSTAAEVMLADRLGQPVGASILREVPAGSRDLPSVALGAAGGGDIAVDMSDSEGRTAAEGVFQVELALATQVPVAGIGERVYVRLLHGRESLWRQWSRSVRQLLLSRLQA